MNEENKNKVLTLLDDVRHQKMEALYWLPSYLEKTMKSAEIAYKLGKYDRSIELCFTIINFEKEKVIPDYIEIMKRVIKKKAL